MREQKHQLFLILYKCRIRSGYTQCELTRTANIPDRYIREIENEKVFPGRDILFRIAFTLRPHVYRKEMKEVSILIHAICECRKDRRARVNKLTRREGRRVVSGQNNSDAVRLRRLNSYRFR